MMRVGRAAVRPRRVVSGLQAEGIGAQSLAALGLIASAATHGTPAEHKEGENRRKRHRFGDQLRGAAAKYAGAWLPADMLSLRLGRSRSRIEPVCDGRVCAKCIRRNSCKAPRPAVGGESVRRDATNAAGMREPFTEEAEIGVHDGDVRSRDAGCKGAERRRNDRHGWRADRGQGRRLKGGRFFHGSYTVPINLGTLEGRGD